MNFLKALYDFLMFDILGFKQEKPRLPGCSHDMTEGRLCVSGKNFVVIKTKAFPKCVHVKFVNEEHCHLPVPCNPVTKDTLYWYETGSRGKRSIVIVWDVSGVKEIEWKIIS